LQLAHTRTAYTTLIPALANIIVTLNEVSVIYESKSIDFSCEFIKMHGVSYKEKKFVMVIESFSALTFEREGVDVFSTHKTFFLSKRKINGQFLL